MQLPQVRTQENSIPSSSEVLSELDKTINAYTKAKIEMLTKDFLFNLTQSEVLELSCAKSEIQCDQIAHSLFNKYM